MNKGVSFRRRLLKTAGSKKEIRTICFSTLNPNEQQTISCHVYYDASFEYSLDGINFQNYVSDSQITFGGDIKVYFRGISNRIGYEVESASTKFKLLNDDVKTKCDGNIMCLVNYQNIKTTIEQDKLFMYLFKDCKALYTAPDLLFTNTTSSCCSQMFKNCTSLIKIPKMIINENNLKISCFNEMFNGCENLQNIDNVDITFQTIGYRSFYYTFANCSNLKTIPFINGKELRLYRSGCVGMFSQCTNLEENVNLIIEENKEKISVNDTFLECFKNCEKIKNANIIINDDFSDRGGYLASCFQGCIGLENVNINYESNVEHAGGFDNMFLDCTSLKTFNNDQNFNCYITKQDTCKNMFKNCTSLEVVNIHFVADELIKNNCYYSMFNRCESLRIAPELPATILSDGCYANMFYGCLSLITAPNLPAIILTNNCYNSMFKSCSNLNYIKCLAEDFSATECLTNWVQYVSSTGTFIKKDGARWDIGNSGIPTNWIVENVSGTILNLSLTKDIISEKYGSQLNIESDINWEVFSYPNWVQLDKLSGSGNDVINVQYVDYQQGKLKTGTIFVKNLTTNTTEQINLYGLNTIKQELTFIISSPGTLRWKFDSSGEPNPKTIEYTKDGGTTWTSITSSDNNSLNGINVLKGDIISFRGNNAAYAQDNNIGSQFDDRTSVTSICGNIMSLIDSTNFENLTQLTQPFALHALFKSFTKLINASNLSLPATTLTQSCYRGMFDGCTKLLYAPEFLASQLVQDCYRYIFNACSSLIYIKCLCDTTINSDTYTQKWTQGVKNTNECKFVKKSTTQIYRNNQNGIPSNWVIENV